jgi:hypothetical protein
MPNRMNECRVVGCRVRVGLGRGGAAPPSLSLIVVWCVCGESLGEEVRGRKLGEKSQ